MDMTDPWIDPPQRTDDAWTYLIDNWVRAPQLSWEDYCTELRGYRGYSKEYPEPGPSSFLECLIWYFHECTRQAQVNSLPEGTTAEEYQKTLAPLFWDFYPTFYEAYVGILAAYWAGGADSAPAHQHTESSAPAALNAETPSQPGPASTRLATKERSSRPDVTPELIIATLEEFADPDGSITAGEIARVAKYLVVEVVDDDTPPSDI
ncbi:hypothetical protein [Streptomyces sp. NPDC047981]|uniref:hypothetical protein n=1 Tax=Streptomyces sp. NPDC047981 TaxID=3154610 RepID=UPI003445F8F3